MNSTVRTIAAMCFLSIFILSLNMSFAQTAGKKNHEIPLDSAKKYIHNLKNDAMTMKINGGMFNREVFDKILAQKGVTGIRYYYAKMDDGSPTLVVLGVDSTGKDMTNGVIAEKIYPCPPYCDEESAIHK